MQTKESVLASKRYTERHVASCKICSSSEYQSAQAILRRSGLRVDQWGFLLHDIASHLRGDGPYILTDESLIPENGD